MANITLEVGKKYVSRGGRIFAVTEEDENFNSDSDYRFDGVALDNPECSFSWCRNGVFELGFESEYDLVAECVEPKYRYFADREVFAGLLTVWRFTETGPIEAKHYGRDGDPWEVCLAAARSDFDNPAYFECDADRNPLVPTPDVAAPIATRARDGLAVLDRFALAIAPAYMITFANQTGESPRSLCGELACDIYDLAEAMLAESRTRNGEPQ